MGDIKINMEVVCALHFEKLEVAPERGSKAYDYRLCVSACSQCLADAIKEADPTDLPTKTAELVFNDSPMTSVTLEV